MVLLVLILFYFLKKKKFNVASIDNLSKKGSKFNLNLLKINNIKNYNFDISKKKFLNKLPKFDLIIDCCAEAAVEFSKKNLKKLKFL